MCAYLLKLLGKSVTAGGVTPLVSFRSTCSVAAWRSDTARLDPWRIVLWLNQIGIRPAWHDLGT